MRRLRHRTRQEIETYPYTITFLFSDDAERSQIGGTIEGKVGKFDRQRVPETMSKLECGVDVLLSVD